MNELMLEFDIEVMKADQEYELESVKVMEILHNVGHMISEGYVAESADIDAYYAEGVEKAVAAIKAWFEKMVETIKKFVKQAILAWDTKMTQLKMNAKLASLKKELATKAVNKDAFMQKEVTIFDKAKYFKAYTQYIDAYIKLEKQLVAHTYKGYDDMMDKFKQFEEEFDKMDKELGLNEMDKFRLRVSVNNAIDYSVKEAASFGKIAKIIEDKWMSVLDTSKKAAEGECPYRAAAAKKAASNTGIFKKIFAAMGSTKNMDTIANVADQVDAKADKAEASAKPAGKDLTSDKEKKNMDNDKKADNKN